MGAFPPGHPYYGEAEQNTDPSVNDGGYPQEADPSIYCDDVLADPLVCFKRGLL